jgi:hypothetical protein
MQRLPGVQARPDRVLIVGIIRGAIVAFVGGLLPPCSLWLWILALEGRDAEMWAIVAFSAMAVLIGFCAGMAVAYRSSADRK